MSTTGSVHVRQCNVGQILATGGTGTFVGQRHPRSRGATGDPVVAAGDDGAITVSVAGAADGAWRLRRQRFVGHRRLKPRQRSTARDSDVRNATKRRPRAPFFCTACRASNQRGDAAVDVARATSRAAPARPSASSSTKRIAAVGDLLVASHQLEPALGRDLRRRGRQLRRSDEVDDAPRLRSGRARTRARTASPRSTMPAATASPCSHVAVACAASIAWPNVWPKFSSARSPVSRSSAATIAALIAQLAMDRVRRARPRRCASSVGMFASSHAKNVGVADRAVLDHFGEPGAQLAVGQRRQAIGVDQHGARLVERADHVLAERMVDAGLAADRRVDLREQRGRHLHERHAALVDRGGEARRCRRRRRRRARSASSSARRAARAAASGDRRSVAAVLVRLAVGQQHDVDVHAALAQRRLQRREMMRGDDGVGDDHRARAPQLRLQQLARAREQAAADVDRIGARRRAPTRRASLMSAARRASAPGRASARNA